MQTTANSSCSVHHTQCVKITQQPYRICYKSNKLTIYIRGMLQWSCRTAKSLGTCNGWARCVILFSCLWTYHEWKWLNENVDALSISWRPPFANTRRRMKYSLSRFHIGPNTPGIPFQPSVRTRYTVVELQIQREKVMKPTRSKTIH